MHLRLGAAAGTAVLGAGMLITAPPASAANPVTKFNITVGNTYTKGTITWYNRSITVTGEHKSVDPASCRGTTAFPLDAAGNELNIAPSPSAACGDSEGFGFTTSVSAPGGAATVRICLDYRATSSDFPSQYLKCSRYGR
ncbi:MULTISPECIES: hypothetical protein [unclassified Streptomyces]|uniref:hypothetical protein n=1 Tax=unclassified Streptomyces TaxID=2593676 RepID=UPI0036E66B9B